MKLTEDQKQRIILSVGERENDNLTVPLLQDYIFPLVERTAEESFGDAEALKYELREIAFDFLLEQLRGAIPGKTDQELLEAMPPEQLQGTIVFAALTLQAVLSQLRYESAVAVTAHEESRDLDEELKELLEEK